MANEADTCRKYIVPKLQAAGWDSEPHRLNEQVTFTDGRIVPAGGKARRKPGKRADYVLRYRPDFPIAVVEAKPEFATPGEGLQQAEEYAESSPDRKTRKLMLSLPSWSTYCPRSVESSTSTVDR